MGEPGYVYALINHSMPGMVKVGMTTRAPQERVAELSSATGVPHPFELVFDILVPDVARAERVLHRELAALGGRVNDNREFFQVPLREVVGAMLRLREDLGSPTVRGVAGPAASPEPDVLIEWDELFKDAAEVCIQNGGGSTSLLQRRLGIGYGRAARITDQLHDAGVLGHSEGASEREVLVDMQELEGLIARLQTGAEGARG